MVNILWDESHLWGYLLLHAMQAAEIPHRLVKGVDIAQAGLSGKFSGEAGNVLIVPGGTARGKAKALGKVGQEAIRGFVANGGHYLGFCGGAGLALADGLGLCPWHRAGMTDRLQHLVSGHVLCDVTKNRLVPPDMPSALLPVWWPGRFHEPETETGVRVLARYQSPGADLYVADLPLRMMPSDVLADWNTLYGVTLRPSLLDDQPCVIAGEFGRGDWLLSYSHLETPSEKGAPGENDSGRWLLHILKEWTGNIPSIASIPPWQPDTTPIAWEDPILLEIRDELANLTNLARELGLLFPRTSWLMGWKTGMPGAQLNSLRLAALFSLSLAPTNARLRVWHAQRGDVAVRFRLFAQGARSWLLARRLSDTLADTLASSSPDVLPKALLTDQRHTLFGAPMSSGGLCGTLLADLEGLLFFQA